MTVRIAKPPVNIREKLTELERPIGLKGSELMRAETAQDVRNFIGAGRKNLLINGNFRISQRGDYTSATVIGGTIYTLDRWKTVYGGGGTVQHKKNQLLPNGNISDSVRAITTSTGYVGLEQFIEFPEIYSGQTFTVSFWIKTNYISTEINVYNGSAFVLSSTAGRLNEVSGDWKYFTRTFTMPSSGNTSFRIEFWSGDASTPTNSYMEIAQVQVEKGTLATEFEQRSYGEELALCQRYYEKSFEDTTTPSLGANSTSFSTEVALSWGLSGHRAGYPTNAYPGRSTFAKFRVPKRVAPSVSLYGNNSGLPYIYDITNGARWVSANWYVSASKEGFEMVNEFTSVFELYAFCHWTASAEL